MLGAKDRVRQIGESDTRQGVLNDMIDDQPGTLDRASGFEIADRRALAALRQGQGAVEGADHFFTDHLSEVESRVRGWARRALDGATAEPQVSDSPSDKPVPDKQVRP